MNIKFIEHWILSYKNLKSKEMADIREDLAILKKMEIIIREDNPPCLDFDFMKSVKVFRDRLQREATEGNVKVNAQFVRYLDDFLKRFKKPEEINQSSLWN